MISRYFGRTVDYDCEIFVYFGIGEGFENNFIAYSVDVALCNADYVFVLTVLSAAMVADTIVKNEKMVRVLGLSKLREEVKVRPPLQLLKMRS